MNERWTGRAGFVSRPRTIDDLRDEKNTRLEEIDYEVTTIVNLDSVDYENFITNCNGRGGRRHDVHRCYNSGG